MSILDWLFRKGLAGAISRDLINKYMSIKSQYPYEEEKTLTIRVWNLWLTMNEEAILSEDDDHKNVRLRIIKEQHDCKTELDVLTACSNLFDLYRDILYIETEIAITDGKLWNRAVNVFLGIAEENGLNYKKEYDFQKRFMKCS